MTSAESLDELAAMVSDWASAELDIARVWLYGSRVRGCGRDGDPIAPDSDLDVAVELVPDPNEEGLGQLIAFLSRARPALAAGLPVPLHLEVYDPLLAPDVVLFVADCSKLIYERFKCGP